MKLRLLLAASLAFVAAFAIWFFLGQNAGVRHGGPISPPKMLWLAYAVAGWFVVPLFLWRDRRIDPRVRRVFGFFALAMWARGVAELILLYAFQHWTPLYGIAHDLACILLLVFLRRGIVVSNVPSRRALAYTTSLLVALVAEICFAGMFLQTRAHEGNVYFASTESRWLFINVVTSLVLAFVTPDLASLLAGLWFPGFAKESPKRLRQVRSAWAALTGGAAVAGLAVWTAQSSASTSVPVFPAMGQEVFFAIGAGIVLTLILLELRVPSFRRGLFSDRPRVLRNWPYLFSMTSTVVIATTVTHHFPRVVPTLWPLSGLGVQIAACFVVGELVNYGLHWVQHHHRYLWRFHFQHHREENYDLWLAAHFHAVEIFVSSCVMSAVMALFGFAPLAKQIYFLFYILVTTYHHSSQDYSLGFLDRLVVSPAFHRLHHAVDIRGNYGSTLTLFDLLFGTAVWPGPERKIRYGIRPNGEPSGFLQEMLYILPRRRVAS